VSDGWVTLEGEVDRWTQREDAEHAVRHLAGVQGVTNRITVRPPHGAAETVRTAIEDALERRVEREAEARQGGSPRWDRDPLRPRAVLAGETSVLGAAGHAPGVHGVEDKIRIEPWL
jgi:osmotically-inducible protein OsmY